MEKYESLRELILALLLWITSNTDYKDPEQFPQIKFLGQSELSQIACGRECEILAYTPTTPKYTIFLSDKLKPMTNVCDRGILLHELIHVLQDDQEFFVEYEIKTKKHLREMDALVKHNIFLSQYGKKILYSNGFAAKFKTQEKNTLYC